MRGPPMRGSPPGFALVALRHFRPARGSGGLWGAAAPVGPPATIPAPPRC